jgi:hypothetical protein
MRTGPSDTDAIFRHLKRLGWSVGETGGTLGVTVELARPGRLIMATAPTISMAWPLAKRA